MFIKQLAAETTRSSPQAGDDVAVLVLGEGLQGFRADGSFACNREHRLGRRLVVGELRDVDGVVLSQSQVDPLYSPPGDSSWHPVSSCGISTLDASQFFRCVGGQPESRCRSQLGTKGRPPAGFDRLFPTTTKQPTRWFQTDLHRRHPLDNVRFLVADAEHFVNVLAEDGYRFQVTPHGNRNAIERVFREVERRPSSFANSFGHVALETAESWLESFAVYHNSRQT